MVNSSRGCSRRQLCPTYFPFELSRKWHLTGLLLLGAEIRTIAPTCLHIGGVQGAIEDEAKLVDIFSRFGTVLAVTLRIRREGKKVSWALVSFSSVSEADSCLAGMGELAKQHPGLVARQVDENQVG